MSIKFSFNSLPNWIAYLVQYKMFIGQLKSVIMEQSFYSLNDLLDYCGLL